MYIFRGIPSPFLWCFLLFFRCDHSSYWNPRGMAQQNPRWPRGIPTRFSTPYPFTNTKCRSVFPEGLPVFMDMLCSILINIKILWLIMFPGKKWKQSFGKTVVSISMFIEGYPFWWGHWPNLFNWILLRSRNATSKHGFHFRTEFG